jgi:hypothetical protein
MAERKHGKQAGPGRRGKACTAAAGRTEMSEGAVQAAGDDPGRSITE